MPRKAEWGGFFQSTRLFPTFELIIISHDVLW